MQVCDESSQTLCTVSFWLMATVVIASPMGRPATKLALVSQDERPRPDAHEGRYSKTHRESCTTLSVRRGRDGGLLRRDGRGAHAAWPWAGVSVRGSDVLQHDLMNRGK